MKVKDLTDIFKKQLVSIKWDKEPIRALDFDKLDPEIWTEFFEKIKDIRNTIGVLDEDE